MAISDNTTGLQEILAAVNSLPEAGGGEVNLSYGTFKLTASANEVQLQHNLGKKPNFIVIFPYTSNVKGYGPHLFCYNAGNDIWYGECRQPGATSINFFTLNGSQKNLLTTIASVTHGSNDNAMTVHAYLEDTNNKIADVTWNKMPTYLWIVGVIDIPGVTS